MHARSTYLYGAFTTLILIAYVFTNMIGCWIMLVTVKLFTDLAKVMWLIFTHFEYTLVGCNLKVIFALFEV